jgi:hypothetical protein
MSEPSKKRRQNAGPSGPLYDLLMKKLPTYHIEYGGRTRLDIYNIAGNIGVSYQHIYQVLPSGDKPSAAKNLSVKLARKLIECSENQDKKHLSKAFAPLTLLDLEPFLPS